jgi:hypothetical protein
MISQVRANIMAAINTENGGETLALGRNLLSYIISANIVGLSSTDDATFKTWLRGVLRENLSGRTLVGTHEERPNNWGTHAGASRIAAAIYLGDQTELARAAQVFKGWVGDRSSYAGFSYGDLDWQSNPSAPVGINPKTRRRRLLISMARGRDATWRWISVAPAERLSLGSNAGSGRAGRAAAPRRLRCFQLAG